jgi:DNA processing protein
LALAAGLRPPAATGDTLLALAALPAHRLAGAAGQPWLVGPPEPQTASGAPASPAASQGTELCPHCAGYPAALRELPAAPSLLYTRGRHLGGGDASVTEPLAVALVGQRRAGGDAHVMTARLAGGLARAGVTVVAELAPGVGAVALLSALSSGGSALAVASGAIPRAQLGSLARLERALLARATILSEVPWDAPSRPWREILRWRIVAGLVPLTVVIEAGDRAGAMIAAAVARDAGRDVAAVPGSPVRWQCEGSNALLRDGAHFVTGVQDVLDLLFGVGVHPGERAGPEPLAIQRPCPGEDDGARPPPPRGGARGVTARGLVA